MRSKIITILIAFFVLFGACNCIWNWTLASTNFGNQVLAKELKLLPVSQVFSYNSLAIPNTAGVLTVEQEQLPLKADTWYRLEFDLELQKQDELPQLYFDLYGTGYDYAQQDLQFDFMLGRHRYTIDFNTQMFPDDMVFRTVYSTKQAYTLENMTLSELRGE